MRLRSSGRLLRLALVVTLVSLFTPPGPLPTAHAATSVNYSGSNIPAVGPAAQYPSIIVVSGVTGIVSKVTVKLTRINHAAAGDLDISWSGLEDNRCS